MLYDVHTHFFNRDMLSNGLAKQINNLTKLRPIRKNHLGQNNGVISFLRVAMNYYEGDLLKKFEESYGHDCIVVPLMLDISYIADEADKSIKTTKSNAINDIINNIKNEIVQPKNFQAQIDSLVRLKEAFPDRVYPFFSIDPRQERVSGRNLIDLLKKYVGKDKPFLGVKLYSSTGFSPTDPLLYNSDPRVETVYQYCQKNKIPITLHFSSEGFSTLTNSCRIFGDVYDPKSGNIVNAQEYFPDGILKFDTTHNLDFDFNPAIEERLLKLNHPKLWEKVLKRYPKLYINFAHFGGSNMNHLYLESPDKGFWTKYVIDFITKYKNTYTDLSCFTEETGTLSDFKTGIYDKLPAKCQKKIMYGSDYHILTFCGDDLPEYITRFKSTFKSELELISEKNIKQFLRI